MLKFNKEYSVIRIDLEGVYLTNTYRTIKEAEEKEEDQRWFDVELYLNHFYDQLILEEMASFTDKDLDIVNQYYNEETDSINDYNEEEEGELIDRLDIKHGELLELYLLLRDLVNDCEENAKEAFYNAKMDEV